MRREHLYKNSFNQQMLVKLRLDSNVAYLHQRLMDAVGLHFCNAKETILNVKHQLLWS